MLRLALTMGRTADELLGSMTSADLTEWLAYAQLEPFGPLRDEWRAAVPASLIANQWRGKDDRPVSPEDLFPALKERRHGSQESEAPTREEIREQARALAEALRPIP